MNQYFKIYSESPGILYGLLQAASSLRIYSQIKSIYSSGFIIPIFRNCLYPTHKHVYVAPNSIEH